MPLKHQITTAQSSLKVKLHEKFIISYLFAFKCGVLVLWRQKTISRKISANTNYSVLFLLLIFLASCSSPKKKENNSTKASGIKYAKGFSIISNEHYKKLIILNPWDNYKPYATYYILKDSIKPRLVDNGLNFYFYQTPKKIALHTAAQATSLKILDLNKYIKGITDPRFFYEQQFADNLEAGKLIQTSNAVQMNKERIILLKPDIIITSGWNNINTDYQLLIKMGFPALFMIEWMESEPLGRAEWIKVIGLIFDKEKEADSLFNLIESNYLTIKDQQHQNKTKPKVLHGEEYNGVWYVAGGKSYIAQIYKDAGADYLWKESDKAGSLTLDIEVVLEKGVNADFWFTTFGQNSEDINHIKQEKYSLLTSVKKETIYSNTNRVRATGGNDFWETGNLRPDLILKDVVQIINQKDFQSDSLFFYKKLNLN